jgi:hypothetical protein
MDLRYCENTIPKIQSQVIWEGFLMFFQVPLGSSHVGIWGMEEAGLTLIKIKKIMRYD